MNIGVIGSKNFNNFHLLNSIINKIIKRSGFSDLHFYSLKEFSFIKETGEPTGLTAVLLHYCELNQFPVVLLDAKWDDINSPNAIIKEKNGKKYNARALFDRNDKFIQTIDLLILIHQEDYDFQDLVERAKKKKILILDFNFLKMKPIS